jgi:hypothetical protein
MATDTTPSERSEPHWTSWLYQAVREGASDWVPRLLGVVGPHQLWQEDSYSRSLPIHYAVRHAEVEVVELILKGGGVGQLKLPTDGENRRGEHEMRGCSGWLPIHHAAAHSRSVEVVALLVRSGPWQLLAKTAAGFTPLEIAERVPMYQRPNEIYAQLRPAEGAHYMGRSGGLVRLREFLDLPTGAAMKTIRAKVRGAPAHQTAHLGPMRIEAALGIPANAVSPLSAVQVKAARETWSRQIQPVLVNLLDPGSLKLRGISEKGVWLAQNMQVGPCIPVAIQP